MIESKELSEEIDKIDAEICRLKDIRHEKLMEAAAAACPFSVGDRTICHGYSHRGKVCIVDRVGYRRVGFGGYEWIVSATVLRKDGERSLNKCDFMQSNYQNGQGAC